MGLNPGDSQPWFLSFKHSEKEICNLSETMQFFLPVFTTQSSCPLGFRMAGSSIYPILHLQTSPLHSFFSPVHGSHAENRERFRKRKICLRQCNFSYLNLLVHKHLSHQDLQLLDPPYIHSYICRHLRCTLYFHQYMWLLGNMLKTGNDLEKERIWLGQCNWGYGSTQYVIVCQLYENLSQNWAHHLYQK